tara:strand:+ start:6599 stop:8134 length:1536 start_codon:yes stop_codon:yes gene_type:complete
MKYKKTIITIVLLLIVGGIWYTVSQGNGPEIQTVIISRDTLVQEVSVTGAVEPKEAVDLAFESGGTIQSLPFRVGETVAAGNTLARINASELEASYREAEASVRVEEARLSALKSGSRTQEVEIKQTELEDAETDLENLFSESLTLVQGAQNDVDKALNDDLDAFFTNDSTNPQLTFFVTTQIAELRAEDGRREAQDAFESIISIKNNLIAGVLTAEVALSSTLNELRTVEAFLDDVSEAINKATGVSATTLATYKTDVNTARASINISTSGVETQTQAINAKKLTLSRLEQELDLTLEGNREEDILAQEAALDKAEATRDRIGVQLSKTVLRSPIDGVVTRVEGDVGEIVTAGTAVVSVISEGQFEITAFVPEVDVAKLSVGNNASLTLDAYGSSVEFLASVVEIEPAERIVEGVPTYKTTLVFQQEDSRIRAGMTANLTIETARRDNAIVMPQRAVITRDGMQYARVLRGTEVIQEKEITTGLRGSGGLVEVLSGLNEGDEVVTFIKED